MRTMDRDGVKGGGECAESLPEELVSLVALGVIKICKEICCCVLTSGAVPLEDGAEADSEEFKQSRRHIVPHKSQHLPRHFFISSISDFSFSMVEASYLMVSSFCGVWGGGVHKKKGVNARQNR